MTDTPLQDDKPALKPLLKFALEFGPLLLFFIINGKFDIYTATAVFMVAFPLSMLLMWLKTRHIPTMVWITGLVVLLFGGLTLYFENDTFIKLKPTIMMAGFGVFFAFDYLRGPTIFRGAMEANLPNPNPALWKPLTRRWAFFFFGMAILNEIVWRTVDTDTWVTIKTFVYVPLTLIFPLTLLPLISRNISEDEEEA